MSRRKQSGNLPALGTKTAVAYLRVSTDDQLLGIEAQRAALEAWALAHGVTIVAWHTDHGVSGAAPADERPGLMAALVDLTALAAGLLLVARRDRIARDVLIALTLERIVSRAGARIVSVDGTGNGDSPADAFMRTVIDAAAAYERDLIRARTKAALAVKKARGEHVGKAPYGYAYNHASKALEPNAAEQALVTRASELRSAGLTYQAVVDTLTTEGYRSRKGTPLFPMSVHLMLQRTAA